MTSPGSQWQSQTQTWACLPLKVVPHCPPSLVSLESRADGDTHCPGGKQSTGGRENPPGPRLEGLCGGFRMMGGISTEMRREGEVRKYSSAQGNQSLYIPMWGQGYAVRGKLGYFGEGLMPSNTIATSHQWLLTFTLKSITIKLKSHFTTVLCTTFNTSIAKKQTNKQHKTPFNSHVSNTGQDRYRTYSSQPKGLLHSNTEKGKPLESLFLSPSGALSTWRGAQVYNTVHLTISLITTVVSSPLGLCRISRET